MIQIIHPIPLEQWRPSFMEWFKHKDIGHIIPNVMSEDDIREVVDSPYLCGIIEDMRPVGFFYLTPQEYSVEVTVFCPEYFRHAMPVIKEWIWDNEFDHAHALFNLSRVRLRGGFDRGYKNIKRWCGYFGWELQGITHNTDGELIASLGCTNPRGQLWQVEKAEEEELLLRKSSSTL